MEQSGQDYVESTGTGVMVCNLPLLFTRGYPSSLQHMKLDELEDFVPFMVRCSLGEENPVPWSQLPRPAWWPRKLPFRIPSGSNAVSKMTALVEIVQRCYSFHGCEYLLQFCASLLEDMPRTGHRFNDNRDGTTSMYHGTTGKLLVTFRNENRDYDKSNHDTNLRKKLLLSPTRVSSSGTTTAVFQPAATDIYLCDKCENEFYSLREVQIHEKKCVGDTPPSPVPPSPDPEPVDESLEPAGQVPFLAYFKLQPAKHTGLEPYMSPRKRSSSPPRKIVGSMFPRFESIPLTSPLGKFLLANSKLRNKYQASQHLVIRYERHLHATPHTDLVFSRDRCNNRWIVVWRPNKEQQAWCHLYCFNRQQKRERRLTIETGLNWRSRKLLKKCRHVTVHVKRLQKRIVDRVTRLNGPTAPCIDLTDEPQRVFTEVFYPGSFLPSSAAFGITLNGTPRTEDPLRLFYDSNETVLNYGASSSSSHPPPVPIIVDSRLVGIGQYANSWGNEADSNEEDPLAFNPGDIINHETISVLPIASPSLVQNHSSLSMTSNATHSTQRNSNCHFRGLSLVPAPGPKCSKINKENKKQLIQQTGNNYVISNSDLLQLTQGNYGVLGRFHNSINEMSVSASDVSGFSESCNSQQNSNQCQESDLRTSVKNSVPQPIENNSMVLPHTAGAPISKNSIEVIDLSSDDDESGRVRVSSEADHAPSQLDGLSCYPHSGAKVPDSSSKSSLPKNGNSHWSSNYKSHCDAGRVGDLATNGQPPNVLKNPATVSSGFHSFKSPLPILQPQEKRMSTRKRRCEDPVVDNACRKLVVLDVSNQGMKVVSVENIAIGDRLAISNEMFSEKTPSHSRAAPNGMESVASQHSIQNTSGKVNALSSIDQSGAFINTGRSLPDSWNAERYSLQSSLLKKSKTDGDGKDCAYNMQEEGLRTEKSSGLFKNLVSTVSKGVEYICSLVGAASTNDVKSVNENNGESSSKHLPDLVYLKDSPLKDIEFGNGKTTKVPREVARLLEDECRELNRNGLCSLRSIDLQNSKVTRRSVERTIPRKAQRRQRTEEDSVQDNADDGNISEKSMDVSVSSKCSDVLSNYMDENGNSPSYSKSKLNKEAQYSIFVDKINQLNHSHVEVSNKNINNNNDKEDMNSNNIVGQLVSGRKDKTFTDHYRGSVGRAIVDRNRLQSGDCNISVHKTTSEVSNSFDLSTYVRREFMSDGRVPGKSYAVLDSEMSLRKELLRESPCDKGKIEFVLVKSKDCHKETNNLENPRRVAKSLFPPEITLLNCSSQAEVLTSRQRDSASALQPVKKVTSSNSPLASTAEDCGALQAHSPISGRMEGSHMLPYLCQVSRTGSEKTAVDIMEWDNRGKGSSSNRKKGHSSPQDLATRDTLKVRQANFFHPVNSLCKSNSSSSTTSEVDNVENIPLYKSLHSVNKKLKDKKIRQGVEPGVNIGNEVQTNLGDNRLPCGITASGSAANQDKACKDESISSQSESSKSGREKRSLLRELNNLGKDEWKEMRKSGFHPSNLLDPSNQCDSNLEQRSSSDESEDEVELNNGKMLNGKHVNGKDCFRKNAASSVASKNLGSPRGMMTNLKRTEILGGNCTNQIKTTLIQGHFKSSKEEQKKVNGTVFHTDLVCTESKKGHLANDSNGNGMQEELEPDNIKVQRKKSVVDKNCLRRDVMNINRKKSSLSRELLNLSKDEWKEIHGTGFHPSDLIVVDSSQILLQQEFEDSDQDIHETATQQHTGNISDQNGTDKTEDTKNVSGDRVRGRKFKKASIPRELANLGKDEWKEMRNAGFHPSDLVGTKNDDVTYFFGESEGEEEDSDLLENNPQHKPLSIVMKGKKEKKKISRELAKLMKDECKELKRKRKDAHALSRINRRRRREKGGLDLSKPTNHLNAVDILRMASDNKPGKEHKGNQFITARNTRSQANVVSLVEVFTPRDSHRQLLHTETAMCVLNFNLPMIS